MRLRHHLKGKFLDAPVTRPMMSNPLYSVVETEGRLKKIKYQEPRRCVRLG